MSVSVDEDGDRPVVPVLAQVVKVLEGLYPLEYAEDWDHPGLVVGDPTWPVHTIVCAVDPRPDVVDQAIAQGADLLITHHPLFFRSVHEVSGLGFRGAMVNRLIAHRCGLWVGHTNADEAYRGVAHAAADLLGLKETRPLVPVQPSDHDLHVDQGIQVGLGRLGRLPEPMTLADLAGRVADILPPTRLGIQVAGPGSALVSTVALLPGSGDSEFDVVRRSGADVYITSDLRHHPATDAYQEALYTARLADAMGEGNQEATPRPMLINTPHSAIESLWFRYALDDIPDAIHDETGFTPEISESPIQTDPWTMVLRRGSDSCLKPSDSHPADQAIRHCCADSCRE